MRISNLQFHTMKSYWLGTPFYYFPKHLVKRIGEGEHYGNAIVGYKRLPLYTLGEPGRKGQIIRVGISAIICFIKFDITK